MIRIIDKEYEQNFFSFFKDIWPKYTFILDEIKLIYAGGLHASRASIDQRSVEHITKEIDYFYKLGKKIFVFDCLYEAVPYNIDRISELVSHFSTYPDITFLYFSGDLEADNIIKSHFLIKNLPCNFIVIGVSFFEWQIKKWTTDGYNAPYIPGVRNKRFLCFNRSPRHHRMEFFEKVIRGNLLSQSYYSFATCDEDNGYLKQHIDNPEFSSINSIKDKIPLLIDNTQHRPLPVDLQEEDYLYFENSYFSVVTETLFYESKRLSDRYMGSFATEKTFKCMIMKHPFIILGPYKILEFLKTRGYNTFSPFIDESYDSIKNDQERLNAVFDEVQRLCSLPEKSLVEFTYFAKDIVEHNYQTLKNVTQFTKISDIHSLLKY